MVQCLVRNQRNQRNHRNLSATSTGVNDVKTPKKCYFKPKGQYFLDKLDGIIHSTDNYTIWNFYHSMCYGKPFPGEIDDTVPGPVIDWDVIAHNDRILMRKINGKWIKEA